MRASVMSSAPAVKLVIGLILAGGALAAYYSSTQRGTDDPPSIESTAVLEPVTAPVANAPLPIKKVEKLEIDIDQLRVMVPGEGWLSARAFWDIYYTDPQKLPGDIDFALLQEFEALTAAERAQAESMANPPPQVADVEEPGVFDNPIPPDDPIPPE